MKKRVYSLGFAVIAILAVWYSCILPEEVCEQETFCEEQSVTYCCTDDTDCYYTYAGRIYSEDQLDELADDLGCNAKSATEKSAIDTKDKLIELMKRVKEKMSR